jgi:hypothetical protein
LEIEEVPGARGVLNSKTGTGLSELGTQNSELRTQNSEQDVSFTCLFEVNPYTQPNGGMHHG